MTIRQRIYLTWLVIHNLEKICRNCPSIPEGSKLIEKAYRRRLALGLPAYVGGLATSQQKEEVRRAARRLTQANPEPDLTDPFGEDA